MEPLLIILLPGILGGALMAFFLAHRPARPAGNAPVVNRALPPPSPSMINVARIQIDGVGGLGMVLIALTVAVSVPWIRLSVLVGLVLGATVAAALITWRRSGPLASSSRHGGAHSDSWAWDDSGQPSVKGTREKGQGTTR